MQPNDDALRQLAREVEPTLADLLRRAYELGYREALAARPFEPARLGTISAAATSGHPAALEQHAPATAPPIQIDLGTTEHAVAGLPAPDSIADPTNSEDEPDDDPFASSERSGLFDFSELPTFDDAPRATATADGAKNQLEALLPLIRPNARVVTLMDRMRHYFGLDRFDIDIVVCRKGDSTRRQLKSNVRLNRYLLDA